MLPLRRSYQLLQVNNVGTNIRNPTEKFTEADYMKVMSTNLESAFFVTQQAYPMLKASGNASVVMISSIAGVVAIRTGSIYAMTKGQCLFVSLVSVFWFSYITVAQALTRSGLVQQLWIETAETTLMVETCFLSATHPEPSSYHCLYLCGFCTHDCLR